MTNPFENTKEPRFPNAYIFDTAKNMFTRGADVHTYGAYSNVTGGAVDTGITLLNYNDQTYYNGSNIGTVSALSGARCLAISKTYLVGSTFQPNTVTIYNVATHAEITTLTFPGPSTQRHVTGDGSVGTFIYDNKLYLTTLDFPTQEYYLYVLNNSLGWDLVAQNIIPASRFSSKDSISDSGWWGIKVDAYTAYNVSRNPRLIKLTSGGTLTEYAGSASEFPGLAETGVLSAQLSGTFRVSNSRIFCTYSNVISGPDKIFSWDISSGSPVVTATQSITLPKLKTLDGFYINDGYVGRTDKSFGTVPLAWERVGYNGSAHTWTVYTGPAPVFPSTINPIVNATGWSRVSGKNNTAAGYLKVVTSGVHSSGIYRFNADFTSELLLPIDSDPANPAFKLLVDVLALDPTNNRLYYLEVGGFGSPPHKLRYYTT
jgi:hypothetical protein